MPDTNSLWGGTLIDLSVDLTTRTVVATINVTENGNAEVYRFRLRDVDELRIDRPDGDWDYTEVTEVHVSDLNGKSRVEMVFWVEPNGLTATAGELVLERG